MTIEKERIGGGGANGTEGDENVGGACMDDGCLDVSVNQFV
jgi:hypothetical protein